MPHKYLPKNSADWALLLLRVSIGSTFIAHGIQKWADWDAPVVTVMGAAMKVLAVAEPVIGVATILGFLAPVMAIGVIAIMLGAIYTKIMLLGGTFAGKMAWELEFLLLSSNVALLAVGPGVLSFDAIVKRNVKVVKKRKK